MMTRRPPKHAIAAKRGSSTARWLIAVAFAGLVAFATPSAAMAAGRVMHPEIGDLPEGATVTGARQLQLSLSAALALATRRSAVLPAADAGVAVYRGKLKEAQSAMYPSIDASAFVTVIPSKRPGTTGENWLADWDWSELRPLATGQVSLTQVLTTFGKLDALEHMATLGVEIAKAMRQVAVAELRYGVTRAWWALVLATDLDSLASRGRAQLDKERARLEELRDDGDEAYDPGDITRLLGIEAEFEEKVRAARRGHALAQDALRYALDLDDRWKITAEATSLEVIDLPLLPMAAYETLAVSNHPRELARRQGVLVRLDQLRYERRKLLPDLVVTGRFAATYAPGVEETRDTLASNPSNPTQSGAGVALRWRLDIFRQFTRIDQAADTWRQDRHKARLEQQKTRAAVRNMWREINDMAVVLRLQGRAMRAVRGQMTQAVDLADKGLGPRGDALRHIEQYVRRRITLADATYRFNVSVAGLSRAVGIDVQTMRPAAEEANQAEPEDVDHVMPGSSDAGDKEQK
jgi:outer membrane protein, multidrug efflux system